MPSEPSCYVLELSVVPGGARRGTLLVYNAFSHLRRLLEGEFFTPERAADNAELALCYGQTMAIWTLARGRVVDVIDLCDHLRLADPEDVFRPLSALFADPALEVAEDLAPPFALDWDALARRLPPLPAPLLRPGESMAFTADRALLGHYESRLLGLDTLRYGLHDAEYGPHDAPWDDPDPPHRPA